MKKSFIRLALINLILSQAYASNKTVEDYIRTIKSAKVEVKTSENITNLLNKNRLPQTRPEFCPLNNTLTYKKTLDSLKAIVTVFKDDCFDGNQSLVDQILTSSNQLEEELKKLSEEQGKEVKDVVPSTEEVSISGIPLTQIFNGMNTLLNNNKCSNLDRTPFLERSADIIQTFAQFGLYSPSGITMAYGGLAVSSILRFINNLFSKRFEFENESDIETFVKLNCAYYDVRNQVKALEMFDIDTNEHYKDKEQSKILAKEVSDLVKSLEEAKTKSLSEIEKMKTSEANLIDKDLEKLISPILEKIKTPIVDQPGKSAKYQQAEILGELAFNLDLLLSSLDLFIKDSSGADRFLNILLKNLLTKLETPEELMELSTKDFNDKFLNDLASSFTRVTKSIELKRSNFKETYEETRKFIVDGEEVTTKELREILKSKELLEREKKIKDIQSKISELDGRLTAIINKKEYSSEDSGDGGIREIIKSLDTVKNHVYGKYGKQFIDKMRDLSEEQNKNFNEKFKNIDGGIVKNGEYPNADELNEDRLLNACVEASTAREIWVYAQKLSELGYDFLATNNDIFGDPDKNKDRKVIKEHNDSAILARRIITVRNYQKKIATYLDLGMNDIEIDGKKMDISQAQDEMKYVYFYGKKMTVSQALDFLDKEYGQKGLKNDRIGKIMIDIMGNRDRTVLLQNLYKDYSCDSITNFAK